MKEFGNGKSSPKDKEEKKDELTEVQKNDIDEIMMETPSIEGDAKAILDEAADILQGPDVDMIDGPQEAHDYLEEGSKAQEEVLAKSVANDEHLVVDHDYGSSEWKLITSAINEKIGYRSYAHAMPIGTKGSKGILIKTMVIQQGSCAVHTIYNEKLRLAQDPEAVNLFILK